MKYSNFNEEKKLRKKGFKRVACLDEAGRGPLAGPVAAAAVFVRQFSILNLSARPGCPPTSSKLWRAAGGQFSKLRDSKQLSEKQREYFYKLIIKNPNIKWGIGIVSEKVIDKINILEATKLAMEKAVKKMPQRPDFLVLDGNMKINSEIPQKSVIGADEKISSCALASILAKVTRDRIMMRYHKKYPKYKFNLHKGYPTKLHKKLLEKYGASKIHRMSFGPVKRLAF
ncbi:MAG: ribonuclease HII [Candidatus Pacebacteria bacterium]|nr:ribonuclease HII [Candidatus Paceibacterota bacterium]